MVEQSNPRYTLGDVDDMLTINSGMENLRKQSYEDRINAQIESAQNHPIVIHVDSPSDRYEIERLVDDVNSKSNMTNPILINDDEGVGDEEMLIEEHGSPRKKVDLHIQTRTKQKRSKALVEPNNKSRRHLWIAGIVLALFICFVCMLAIILAMR